MVSGTGGRWIRWLALHGKAIRIKPVCELVFQTGHWPVGFKWVRIRHRDQQKEDIRWMSSFCWWGKVDSNHRSYKQQIYSLSPLATREFPQICCSCQNSFMISRFWKMSRSIFEFDIIFKRRGRGESGRFWGCGRFDREWGDLKFLFYIIFPD